MRLPHALSGGSVGCVGPLARSTFYPCRHAGRTPYASCAVERVAANPLHLSAPSLNDGKSLAHPARGRAHGPVVHVQPLSVAPVKLWKLWMLWMAHVAYTSDCFLSWACGYC